MILDEIKAAALVTNWSSIKTEHPAPGIQRQMVIGERIMICRFTFEPFLVTPEHTHHNEQMTMVVKGNVEFIIEGKTTIAVPGDVLHFPPNNRHGATMLDEEVVLIDIFSPVREDFLPDHNNGNSPSASDRPGENK